MKGTVVVALACLVSVFITEVASLAFKPSFGVRSLQPRLTSSSSLRGVIEVSDADDGSSKRDEIMSILGTIVDPASLDSIVAAGMVGDVRISPSSSSPAQLDVKILLNNAEAEAAAAAANSGASLFNDEVKNLCILQLSMLEWVGDITVAFDDADNYDVGAEVEVGQEQVIPAGMKGVKRVIAVSSCKGGVGKSTTSVNLAYTLREKGYKVGILDADVYGPSLPTMTSAVSLDLVSDPVTGMLQPLQCEQGVKLMSMGFINKGAAIMRGPMVNQVLNQFVGLCDWGMLDYLVIDMPPGTGDIQLTLAQTINVDAAVIVTTPQRLSFVDVVKGIDLFDSVNIPCVAVVENMAFIDAYEFPEDFYPALAAQVQQMDGVEVITETLKAAIDGQKRPTRVFGQGHASRMQDMWGIESIVSLPLMKAVSRAGDTGKPYVLHNQDSVVAQEMRTLASNVEREIDRLEGQQHTVNYDSAKGEIQYSGSLSPSSPRGEEWEKDNSNGNDPGLKEVQVTVSPFDLRCGCRCALCVEEMTGRPLLDVLSVDPRVKPTSMAPIGRYAMSVDWSDGHRSLFPFRQIAALADKFKFGEEAAVAKATT
jgi:Mrp family chromosome partitioning ATPase